MLPLRRSSIWVIDELSHTGLTAATDGTSR